MTNNDDLEKMIKAALTGQDREILEGTEELGWFALGLKQFSGKLGWVTWVLMVVQTTMFIAGAYFGIKFLNASELLPAVKNGIGSAVLLLMATQIKMSLMPQMQADRVIREVKRLQLLIASHGT
ncbi:DUF6768 family protein [Cognatishimia maritima]|uniref:Uncharacterized protein n=1 Tax=Cognatishimia maritima TaxID=870908 RepID=A0A1M5VCA2_9RHOB|nr:DUF6768 family protein [Cognatishimia maritima]SHH72902.1 hypothetical protein SAMN04488044_3115 [Cognatishimia maritima]